VGQFCSRVVCDSTLVGWLDVNRVVFPGYRLIFHTPSPGCIIFKFNWKEDMEKIFSCVWNWGSLGLILKEWVVNFDPSRDTLFPTKVWEIMSNLPMVF
jgi:hypothetical protein